MMAGHLGIGTSSLPALESQNLEIRATIPALLLNQYEQIQAKSEPQNGK